MVLQYYNNYKSIHRRNSEMFTMAFPAFVDAVRIHCPPMDAPGEDVKRKVVIISNA